MIFHITQGLAKKFNITMAEQLPQEERVAAMHLINTRNWDHLSAWGIKGFDFGSYRCFQMLNFTTKLGFFVFNIDSSDAAVLGHIMWEYMSMLYEGDEQMQQALERYFKLNRYSVYVPLLDKPALASLLNNERIFTNMEKVGKYIDNGVLQTRKLNLEYNKGYLVARILGGRTEFIVPADRFRQVIMQRYGGNQND